jgi:hypothetical protein
MWKRNILIDLSLVPISSSNPSKMSLTRMSKGSLSYNEVGYTISSAVVSKKNNKKEEYES